VIRAAKAVKEADLMDEAPGKVSALGSMLE
jgi:hypothetical protein